MRELDPALEPESAFVLLRRAEAPALFFDGRGGHLGSWPSRVAIAPRLTLSSRVRSAAPSSALAKLDALVGRRRSAGGPGGTGVAVLCGYEAFTPQARSEGPALELAVLEVDATILFPESGPPVAVGEGRTVESAAAAVKRPADPPASPGRPTARSVRPRTSLPREAYVRAVARVKEHIVRGELYQANQIGRAS